MIFLLISWGIISGSLYFVYQTRTADFVINQQEISEHGLKVTAREIENYIERSRHLLSLLINDHLAKIQNLAQDPESKERYRSVQNTIFSHFPEAINFTLVNKDTDILLADEMHLMGARCKDDINLFTLSGRLADVVLHGNSQSNGYHIDIMQKVPDLVNDQEGVFFLSLDSQVLTRMIAIGQPYHHNFYLVTHSSDGKLLIEVSEAGNRSEIQRGEFLSDAEITSIVSRDSIPGTQWEIIDIIDEDYLQREKGSFVSYSVSITVIYLVLSLVFFYLFRRGELKRLSQDKKIRSLNASLSFTIQQRTTQLEQSKQLLTYQSTHDALTGLKNRKEFEYQIAQAIIEIKHNPEIHAVVLYIDIDYFKIINETCGPAAGDEMIKQIAISLSGILRRNDLLARIGGDEFGILLRDCNLVQAELIALTIRTQISTHAFIWDNRKFDISASIGVAEISDEVADASDLLSEVDSACSAAKELGRNQIHFYHPDDTMFRNRRNEMYWSGETIRLIESGRMELFGQKIQSICGHEISNWFEVLVRLRDRDDNLIFPNVFIPALEQYGGIEKLDHQVVTQAIQFLAENPGIRLNINLSGKSVGSEDMLQLISDLISKHRVSPESLVFEITETVAMTNIAQARKFIEATKELGCQLALDDFGSGMSSFSYLKNLDVDYVKLDGSFVRNLHTDPVHYAMVESINSVVQVMGKQCIAEYVENEEIIRQLDLIGIAYGQGYHIHKPQNLKHIDLSGKPSNTEVDFDVS